MDALKKDPQLYASGFDRNRLDRYWTNPWMTDELLKHMATLRVPGIAGPVWECAAGRGDMSRAVQEWPDEDYSVYSTDIDMGEFDYDIGPGHESSFLDETEVPHPPEFGSLPCRSIITNPPYSKPWRGIADDFVEHGLMFMERGDIKFMAMLLRSEFRCGKSKRRRLKFGECNHYMGELVLTTRPRWDYGDPDAPEDAAPRHNFSWFLWQRNCRLDGTNRLWWPAKQWFSYMPKGFKA